MGALLCGQSHPANLSYKTPVTTAPPHQQQQHRATQPADHMLHALQVLMLAVIRQPHSGGAAALLPHPHRVLSPGPAHTREIIKLRYTCRELALKSVRLTPLTTLPASYRVPISKHPPPNLRDVSQPVSSPSHNHRYSVDYYSYFL